MCILFALPEVLFALNLEVLWLLTLTFSPVLSMLMSSAVFSFIIKNHHSFSAVHVLPGESENIARHHVLNHTEILTCYYSWCDCLIYKVP